MNFSQGGEGHEKAKIFVTGFRVSGARGNCLQGGPNTGRYVHTYLGDTYTYSTPPDRDARPADGHSHPAYRYTASPHRGRLSGPDCSGCNGGSAGCCQPYSDCGRYPHQHSYPYSNEHATADSYFHKYTYTHAQTYPSTTAAHQDTRAAYLTHAGEYAL